MYICGLLRENEPIDLHVQLRLNIFNFLELHFRYFVTKNMSLELSEMQFGYFYSFNLFNKISTTA